MDQGREKQFMTEKRSVSPNMKLYDYFYDYDNGLGMIFYEVSDRSVYEARKG